jgi:DNA modification methylase
MNYEQFLKNKIIVAEDFGFDVQEQDLNPLLKPHNKDVVLWALKGGRRAIFLNFGLHKTFTQEEIAVQCIKKTGKPFLIVCPLAVAGEFKRDARKFNIPYPVTYITDTDVIESYEPQIFLTNYERVRMGDIDPSKFGGVSFDEASILRNLQTETTNYVIKYFKQVAYRFVATASPAPNDYIEILNYAVFLNVAERGHLLTRFFQRDSTKAGHLTLYPNKEKEFWQWVSTWAVFVNKPSDLGYSDEGYVFPPLNIIECEVHSEQAESYVNDDGELVFFKEEKGDFKEKSRYRRESIKERCDKALELSEGCKSAIVWHDLEAERVYLERLFKDKSSKAVYGSQSNKIKEDLLISFSEGEYDYLLTKKRIAGSGCNFQEHCHTLIFASIDDKFNDFLQAIHRVLRFGQGQQVDLYLIYTREQYKTLKTLYRKWRQHERMQEHMTELVKEYGLNKEIIKQQMERQLFKDGKKITVGAATLYNNDTVIVHADRKEMPDNSVDMILTSIPFGDHYEYSDNYNDFGHNHGNHNFFKQMDFLTPNLLRVLKPGHVAAIHVKDRIRYSYQNGTSFTTIADFSGQTVQHFEKHGFFLMGKITVTTDVVRENNQTYRLGWSEQCKDATKMGCGMPEYILLFRKPPTESKNAYADEPVKKEKSDYTRATWQLDANAYYRSSGNRFLSSEELQTLSMKRICKAWEEHNKMSIYDFKEHLETCEELEELGRLSSLFMTLPTHSNSEMVWTDVNRMNTLNTNQVATKKEKHICPLQLDIIDRLVNRYTMEGDLVDDPFGGLFSSSYKCMQLNRRSVSVELNSEYFKDGVFYIKTLYDKINMPTLFDLTKEAV